jgi:hypothetical protein
MAERVEAAPPRHRVQDVRLRLDVAPATRIDAYGPTSHLSEDLLLRGYGLLPPRHEERR